jgi:hypothetical protein
MPGVIDHADLRVRLDVTSLSSLDFRSAVDQVLLTWDLLLSNGTGAQQANQVWSDRRTLGPSATENIDLAGALTNAFGVTLTFTRVKLLMIKADAANNVANLVQVTRPAANGVPFMMAASDGFALAPGDWDIRASPGATAIPVTAGTGDLITITNSAGTNSVTYDIVIVGTD